MTNIDFGNLKKLFVERNRTDFHEYEESYNELCKRIKESLCAEPSGEWGDPKRIRDYSLVLRQILLHRAINLFSGALIALLHQNIYSMALSIRGHFETTAALGYLYNRLHSLSEGNIEARTVHHDILNQILGSKEEILKKGMEQYGLETKHVLDMLQCADKSISKNILEEVANKHTILTGSYNFLCEFSHPNYHSNQIAFELKTEEKKFVFMYNKPPIDRDFNVVGWLPISSGLFIELFDRIEKVLPKL